MTNSTPEIPSTATEQGVVTLSEERRQEFATDIEKLHIAKTSGPRDRVVLVLGLVLAIVGLAVALLCYTQATGFNDIRDQTEMMILALFALGMVVLGTGLYCVKSLTRFLRLWLLRLIYEQREES